MTDTPDDTASTSVPPPPTTGNAAVDAALAEVAELAGLPSPVQLERLSLAHEALQRTLTDSAQAPLPAQPRDAHGRVVPGPVVRR